LEVLSNLGTQARDANSGALYWLLRSSVQKQAHQDGKSNPFPACHEVDPFLWKPETFE
jgi:hypothetical protein